MAKFICKVCGQTFEAPTKPEKCPICGADASNIEEVAEETAAPKKKGINTNSNTYTIIYASIVVVLVAFLLSFVSKVLEPQSQANERIDKKKQILSSLNLKEVANEQVEEKYNTIVLADLVVNEKGEVIKEGTGKDKDGFTLSAKEISPAQLPVYVCQIEEGEAGKKYVFPLRGKGLWGAIWGYIALDSDLRTVYGAYFSHEGETAGLGSRITETEFQNQFIGKKIVKEGNPEIALSVVKNGKVQDATVECDGITGATLTSDGVSQMLHTSLGNYKEYLKLGAE